MKKNIYSALTLIVFALLFCASVSKKVTLKTFVDPSLQATSVKSVAVFSLRNTALSPGEALELDRALTQAFLEKNSTVKIMGAAEATTKLNDANLVEDYSKFLLDFEHSGIPNTNTLKKIGTELGVDAILQGTLYQVVQRDASAGEKAETSLTLRYTLLSTKTGNTLWEGTSGAKKTVGANPNAKARPLYEVIEMAQKKIFTGLPVLGLY